MRFSVIVPVYNGERYLSECLESVEAQGCGDLEVIIVDDGSSDSSGQIADEFCFRNENWKVYHGRNEGPLLARRRGLSHCRGEYVVFLDADDMLRADALEIIARAIDESGADIVSFDVSRMANYSVKDGSITFNPGIYEGGRYELVKEHVCRGRFNSLWGKAIRLCRIDTGTAYGAFEGLMHGEDLFQLLPIVDASSSLTHVADVLYFYRPNDMSSTACYRASQLRDIVRVNRRLLDYARRWGGVCLTSAATGEANQYFYLTKINELSDESSEVKRANFEDIRKVMSEEGVFERLRGAGLRLDNRMLSYFLKNGRYGCMRAVVYAVEAVKR